MPQRTNEFQQLVTLVQKALCPAGAKVTESYLEDTATEGVPREIDVLIEASLGPYKMRIAVESRDQGRKLDQAQLEMIVGKYLIPGGIKVDKQVIVTRNGFTDPAIARAKALGVILMTLTEAEEFDWSKLGPSRIELSTGIRIENIKILPEILGVSANQLADDGLVSCSHGQSFGRPADFANYLLSRIFKQHEEELRKVDDEAAACAEGKRVQVNCRVDHPHQIRYRAKQYPLESITFDLHFAIGNRRDSPEARLQFQLQPHICTIEPIPPIEGAKSRDLLRQGHMVCAGCGKDHGTLSEWATRTVIKGLFKNNPEHLYRLGEAVKKSPRGEAMGHLRWNKGGYKLGIRFRDAQHEIEAIRIGVHAVSATAALQCKQYCPGSA